ncbi:hypothetical protein TVAG_005690 [Trichomonas vaginalis G3]|uniref:Uncharacterized protein n=1 Tax=Trichomonas vaginalis (strain ATCC PRA-98 / G3) TaxID=412133 RepID=A2FHQ4_TRIV3|nr:WD repeat-containing protein family [Trichomonas vaginalis G3]EAX95554.1 hypothetical protein TVAG_005690 [Trichomonas vaginalis G3]KAI5520762.1 WD repeat-containing protein family [Trichomonas vaginalis G3]|eukprot:XP_001308484.1 hypothetical protein [Trichomonas vaginalis G3]
MSQPKATFSGLSPNQCAILIEHYNTQIAKVKADIETLKANAQICTIQKLKFSTDVNDILNFKESLVHKITSMNPKNSKIREIIVSSNKTMLINSSKNVLTKNWNFTYVDQGYKDQKVSNVLQLSSVGLFRCANFTPNGDFIVCGVSSNLLLIETSTGKVYAKHTLPFPVSNSCKNMEFIYNGTVCVLSLAPTIIGLFQLSGQFQSSLLVGHSSPITVFAISKDETSLVSGSENGSVVVWDWISRSILQTQTLDNSPVVSIFAFDEKSYCIGYSSGKIFIYNHILTRKLGEFSVPESLYFASKANKNEIITCTKDGSIKVWSIKNEKLSCKNTFIYNNLISAGISPSGNYLVTGSKDEMVALWDLEHGRKLFNIRLNTNSVIHIAHNPKNTSFLTSTSEGNINIWTYTLPSGNEMVTQQRILNIKSLLQ